MPEGAHRRLLIVEEALKDFVGHWYEYVKAVVEQAEADGAAVVVVGHSGATEELRNELGLRPLIGRSPWDGDYRERFAPWRKLGILRHTWLTFTRLRALLRGQAPFDCTFVPTVFVFQIWAWRLLYELYPKRIGQLVLLIRNNAATYRPGTDQPQFGGAAKVLKWGVRSFSANIAARRVVFATDSARLAEEYRLLTGIAPVVFPSPRVAAPPATAQPERESDAPLTFSCLGPARFEKGIDVLQQALAIYLAEPANPPARFVIQWPSPIEDETGAPYPPDPKLVASGRVEFITQPLDSAAYDALLARTDCMVLPYRRSSYFARISGVAVEAATAGIPVIATENTWTSDFVANSGAGMATPDGDAAALAAAMAAMARDYRSYRELAEARKGQALKQHSGQAFLDSLWGTG